MKRWIITIVCFVVTAAAAATLCINGTRPGLIVRATHGYKARQPKVEIVGPLVYDFGKMSQMRTSAHTWEVKNVGDVDLVMWPESPKSSCRIANMVSENVAAGVVMPRARIKPNETTLIEIEWRTKHFVNHYSTTCVVGTNDPERPVFSLNVRGMVDPEG